MESLYEFGQRLLENTEEWEAFIASLSKEHINQIFLGAHHESFFDIDIAYINAIESYASKRRKDIDEEEISKLGENHAQRL